MICLLVQFLKFYHPSIKPLSPLCFVSSFFFLFLSCCPRSSGTSTAAGYPAKRGKYYISLTLLQKKCLIHCYLSKHTKKIKTQKNPDLLEDDVYLVRFPCPSASFLTEDAPLFVLTRSVYKWKHTKGSSVCVIRDYDSYFGFDIKHFVVRIPLFI